MPALTDRDKRTIRLATIAVSIYLVLFFGLTGWRFLESRRDAYLKLVLEAEALKIEVQRYETKLLLREKLEKNFNMKVGRLSRTNLVGDASAAIQKAAREGGVEIGPIRESAGNPSARELSSMQIEGTGPVPAMMSLLHRMNSLGFPLIVDSIQIGSEPRKPGAIKISFRVVVLDPEKWKAVKKAKKRNA